MPTIKELVLRIVDERLYIERNYKLYEDFPDRINNWKEKWGLK